MDPLCILSVVVVYNFMLLSKFLELYTKKQTINTKRNNKQLHLKNTINETGSLPHIFLLNPLGHSLEKISGVSGSRLPTGVQLSQVAPISKPCLSLRINFQTHSQEHIISSSIHEPLTTELPLDQVMRESSSSVFYKIVSDITYHHFCHILLTNSGIR